MGKKHQVEHVEIEQSEGGDIPAQQEEQSAVEQAEVENGERDEQDAETQVVADEVQVKPVILGIGQFVRHLLKNSTKTNAEILELVLKTFEGSKTTPACIAWYKTDMRKKGLLDGLNSRGKNKIVEFTAEELAELTK